MNASYPPTLLLVEEGGEEVSELPSNNDEWVLRLGARGEFEDVYRLRIRRNGKEGADGVKVEAVDARCVGASSELMQLLRCGYREYADDGALIRCSCEEGSCRVKCEGGDRRFYALE